MQESEFRVNIGDSKSYLFKDYHTCMGLLYEKGVYKDVSECNAGWYEQIGTLIG